MERRREEEERREDEVIERIILKIVCAVLILKFILCKGKQHQKKNRRGSHSKDNTQNSLCSFDIRIYLVQRRREQQKRLKRKS